MGIFNWKLNKLHGRHTSKKPDLVSSSTNYFVKKESYKEEFMEWPHGLLAIGTIGNMNWKKDPDEELSQDPTPPDEEVAKLQNELNLSSLHHEQADDNYSEAEKTNNDSVSDDDSNNNNKDAHHLHGSKTVAFITRTGKDISIDNGTKSSGGVISKKKESLCFLFKKMVACTSGGLAPAPSLKDPVTESRLEKIMRAILHKKMKIYPQSSNTTLPSKKYLKNRSVNTPKSTDEVPEDDVNETEKGSKWVKTDSEYIVLEI